MKVSAVILDMDGTLTRFNLNSREVKKKLIKEMEQVNVRGANMSENSTIVVLLKQMKEGLDSENYARFRGRLYDLLEQMEVKAAGEAILHPGVLDTLRTLEDRKLRMGLVTSNSRRGTDLTLEHLRLRGFFESVVTRDDCPEMKPDPTPLSMAVKELDVRADETIFVGDSIMDILAASNAGVRSVAVASGSASVEQLIQQKPDYILASLTELPNLIAKAG